jgi:hypothetical protein
MKEAAAEERPASNQQRPFSFLEAKVHTGASDIQADVDAVAENIAWKCNGRGKSRQVVTDRLISETQAQVFALDRPMLSNLELAAGTDHPADLARIKACIFMRGGKRISKEGAVLDLAKGGAYSAVKENFAYGNAKTWTHRKQLAGFRGLGNGERGSQAAGIGYRGAAGFVGSQCAKVGFKPENKGVPLMGEADLAASGQVIGIKVLPGAGRSNGRRARGCKITRRAKNGGGQWTDAPRHEARISSDVKTVEFLCIRGAKHKKGKDKYTSSR